MAATDATHDPERKSWIESANHPGTDFPIQNLPYCVFQNATESPAIGVGIGDQVFNLRQAASQGLLPSAVAEAAGSRALNAVMALSAADRKALRSAISDLLKSDTTADRQALENCLLKQSEVSLVMPCQIGDYTDFYASVFHATNVGSMFRPDNPLLPNYKHIPIGYHGRASSVVVSGTPVKRPVGQLSPAETGGSPTRAACKLLDYELEVGCFVAQGNQLGSTIDIEHAEDYLFGLTLLNDWSARDIQKWEYQPLGPFLAKSFATTIAPWVVTMEALAPFRVAEFERPAGDPTPLEYLTSAANSAAGGVDLKLEVTLQSAQMKSAGLEPVLLSRSQFAQLYWTPAQMVTHHSSNGCNLQPGDLLGSGTVSGRGRDERGCLLELTWDGGLDNPVPGNQRTPVKLPTGEERKFLADGDIVTIVGHCQREGFVRIGFGTCTGQIVAADD